MSRGGVTTWDDEVARVGGPASPVDWSPEHALHVYTHDAASAAHSGALDLIPGAGAGAGAGGVADSAAFDLFDDSLQSPINDWIQRDGLRDANTERSPKATRHRTSPVSASSPRVPATRGKRGARSRPASGRSSRARHAADTQPQDSQASSASGLMPTGKQKQADRPATAAAEAAPTPKRKHKRRRRRRRRRRKRAGQKRGPQPHLDLKTWRKLRSVKATPGPGSYSPVVGRTGRVMTRRPGTTLPGNRGAFFGSSSRPWQIREATRAPGPGAYFTELSAFDAQPESEKVTGAAVGFAKSVRRAEAKRFISAHHSRHHKVTPSGEPGPGQYAVKLALVTGSHPQTRFGTETRDQRRLKFLSPQHTALDYRGRASPGPATYNIVPVEPLRPPRAATTEDDTATEAQPEASTLLSVLQAGSSDEDGDGANPRTPAKAAASRTPTRPASATPRRLRGSRRPVRRTKRKAGKESQKPGPNPLHMGRGALQLAGRASPGPIYFPRSETFTPRRAASFGRGTKLYSRPPSHVPGPGAYSPTKPPSRVHAAHYFPASRRMPP